MQHRHLVYAFYAQLFTSFCFDFSMIVQTVESYAYSVCFCMISPKAIHIVHFYFKRLRLLMYTNLCIRFIIYTHGNKLGNTFSPGGKFEKIHFPFFWRY